MQRGDAEAVERLARGVLLGSLLRAAAADPRLASVDHGGAGEDAVVRRPLHVEHVVDDLLALPRELLLQLRLVVDVARQRVDDPAVERRDDRLADRLKAVLEVEGRKRGLEQRRQHVPVAREPLQLLCRRLRLPAFRQSGAEPELARDDRARGAGDDVGADLRHPSLREVRVALVQRPRDGELEHGVAEELEPLVRGRAVGRPGAMCEDGFQQLCRQVADELRELLRPTPWRLATGAWRRSRRPARRSGSSVRPRPRS